MKETRRRRLPSPAMVVAMAALVVALTGSAVALQGKNSVKSNDIAPEAVRGKDIRAEAVKSKHIKDGKVTPDKLGLAKTDGLGGPVSTTSGPATDLGGPAVKVKVPEGGVVAIYTRANGVVTGGGANARAQVHLFEPTFLPSAPRIIEYEPGPASFRFSAPGTGDLDGTASVARAGWLVFAPPAGTYTFSLLYSQAGGGTATFSEALLWAGVVG